MKGTIHYCLEEMMIERYGEHVWTRTMRLMGYDEDHSFDLLIRDDIDEEESVSLFVKSAEAANVSVSQIFDDFGEHWCCDYAPTLYAAFFEGSNNTKEALLNLDWVHNVVTKKIPNAHPPRFRYRKVSEDVLEVKYGSDRGLIDLFISLIKGLNKKFQDYSKIEKLPKNIVRVTFNVEESSYVDHTADKALVS